eukprot:Phypoly_transcript_04988.p1 GENE.Phypoly_transcript_04988~~Phypoly_transcript_04988.p1  ORF type:complete len:586 (+),score=105.70 Phypoly_transcript_04988:254-2011(+)
MKSVKLLFVLCVILLSCAQSRPVAREDIDRIPNRVERAGHRLIFDFIVVGAGAAGCIVAGRLANETTKNVLLLEGGARGTGQKDIGGTDYVASHFIKDPSTGKQKLGEPLTRYDLPLFMDSTRSASDVLNNMWNISAVGFFYPQAKLVGGNQATNGAGWYVPQKKDMDAWGVPGYNGTEFFPYITKLENATATGFPNRGTSGLINIEFGSFMPKEQSLFVDAAIQAGYPNGGDMANGDLTVGYYKQQYNTKNGIRESTSVTHVRPVLGKSNFEFRTNAIVTRVLFNVFGCAIGVEYADANGNLKKVYALKEVIITAGALQSAKILFNSGIGPKSILDAFNKPERVINEIIGQKVRNQQDARTIFFDPTFQFPNFYTLPAQSVQFARDGTGLFNKQTAFISSQISPTAPYPELFINVFAGGQIATDPYTQNIQVSVYLNQQIYANGTLNLTSSDPLAGTFFVVNSLVVRSDAEMVAQGILEVRRIMSYWNNGTAVERAPGTNYTSVAELADWVQANPFTSCHIYSSVPIGTDPSSPLDPRMLVRGVNGLRVVGPASVPGGVSMGMQVLAMAFGEKGTDLIKEDHGL